MANMTDWVSSVGWRRAVRTDGKSRGFGGDREAITAPEQRRARRRLVAKCDRATRTFRPARGSEIVNMNVVVHAARNIEGLASKIENDSLVRIRDLNDLFLDWIPARDVVNENVLVRIGVDLAAQIRAGGGVHQVVTGGQDEQCIVIRTRNCGNCLSGGVVRRTREPRIEGFKSRIAGRSGRYLLTGVWQVLCRHSAAGSRRALRPALSRHDAN